MRWSRIVVFPDGWLRLIVRDYGLLVQVVGLIFDMIGLIFETIMDVSHWNRLGTRIPVVPVPAVAVIRFGLQVIEVQIAVDSALGHASMLARQR